MASDASYKEPVGLTSLYYTIKHLDVKPKDLVPIPWLVALALMADGWYLRSSIIWAKGVSGQKELTAQVYKAAVKNGVDPVIARRIAETFDPYVGNPMPESCQDRCTTSHEYVFLLTKAKTYYYDNVAIADPSVYPNDDRKARAKTTHKRMPTESVAGIRPGSKTYPTRNRRTVWTIPIGGYKGAHYAAYPPGLVEPMIKAGTSLRGCCGACGAPWKRIVDREFVPQSDVSAEKGVRGSEGQKPSDASNKWEGSPRGTTLTMTMGWRPTCSCYCGPAYPEPIPCTILDPFAGTGTTAEAAIRLGRRCVLVELSQLYCDDHIIPRLERGIPVALF